MKHYLGDGVYVEEQEKSDSVILMTEDERNTIILNVEVQIHLWQFLNMLETKA